MASTADNLVADYLKTLDSELRGLPRPRRTELMQEISEHIAEAREGLDPGDEEQWTVSVQHTDYDIDRYVDAFGAFCQALVS